MATKNPHPPALGLLPITTVAKILGLKYDSLKIAVEQGRLQVRYCSMKPGGFFQPLITIEDAVAFQKAYADRFRDCSTDFYDELVRRLDRVKFPRARIPLDEVMRARPPSYVGRARTAKVSA